MNKKFLYGKEKQMLKMYQVSSGVYQTKDDLFRIKKIDNNKWSWFVRSGSGWIAKDKRQYKTKTWCERCIEVESGFVYDDETLWEG
jgi:hypothetical protein